MSQTEDNQVTLLLESLGDSHESLQHLANLVYQDIHRLAHNQRYHMRAGETLRTTALVNEAFLKIFRDGRTSISNRQHLMRLAAKVIRQIIVDHARSRLAQKRGSNAVHLQLEEFQMAASEQDAERVLDIESAITRLTEMDSELADLVSARFFAGYTTGELAELHGISRRTVQRQLQRANAWLRFELDSLG